MKRRIPWTLAVLGVALWLAPIAIDATTAAAKPKNESKDKKQAESTAKKPAGEEASKETMTLPAGQEGTAFGSLTVQGEDRIRIEFGRPTLDLDLDPRKSPGLELGDARAILDREQPDLVTPYLDASALQRTPYLGSPWFDEMTTGAVAVFRPEVTSVERWRMAVVDSRGDQVMEWQGKGSPPKQIEWDGMTAEGAPCLPGLTYSYVFEAFDRAGNKRNFVGEGFQLPPYRRMSKKSLAMLFAGDKLGPPPVPGRAAGDPTAIVLEAASWINQVGNLDQPIQVKATARSFEMASAMTQNLVAQLQPLLLGDTSRIQPMTSVEANAPQQGTVAITVAP